MLEQGIPCGAESTVEVAKAAAGRRSKRSAAAKLLQAAALAAALVPLGAVKADAESCTFFSGGGFSCASGPNGGALYNFGPYATELRFDSQLQQFTVEIVDVAYTYQDMKDRFTQFPGYEPVPICPDCVNQDLEPAPYIDFQVTDPPEADVDYESEGPRGPDADLGYDLYIYWLADTNGGFPNPQVLHQTGGTGGEFDMNMTIPGSYFSEPPDECVFNEGGCSPFEGFSESDPGVGGRDNMFSSYTLGDPTASAVPEPASLILLGTGISSLVYRRRRRKN